MKRALKGERGLPPTWAVVLIAALAGLGAFLGARQYAREQGREAQIRAIQVSASQQRTLAVGIADTLYGSQIAGCLRGNLMRLEVNITISILRQALREEQAARLAKASIEKDPRLRSIDRAAVKKYALQERGLRNLALVNCRLAYPRPIVRIP